jgi:RimJ/RimL family protein N-acetyltransferase
MPPSFLEGEQVYLRLLEESDVSEEYLQRINEPDLGRYLALTGEYPATKASLSHWLQKYQGNKNNLAFVVADSKLDRKVGVLTLSKIRWIDRRSDITLMPTDQDFWKNGRFTEALRLLINYAFRRLGLLKLCLNSYTDDDARIKAVKELGFQLEATSLKDVLFDGDYHDVLVFGLLHDELVPTR